MKTIRVNIGDGYDITVGGGLIRSLGKSARALPVTKDASRAVLVSDGSVSEVYSADVTMSLKLAGYTVTSFVLSPGETIRKLNTVSDLCSEAAKAGLRQGDFFVALGGVIACDIAGMAAALYLGGAPLIMLPTTTIAQIARTAGNLFSADLVEERRILGVRWAPSLVLCDTDVLKTQNKRSVKNGAAEIIRMACVSSDKLLDDLDNAENDMERLIVRAINTRIKLLGKDGRDSGHRSLLQFGSLISHAIEEIGGYSHDHGESLSAAMVITCAAGERAGITQVGTTERLEQLLKKHGLPSTTNIPAERLLKAVANDRFITGSTMTLPLIKAIGDGYLHRMNVVELRNFFISSLPDWAK